VKKTAANTWESEASIADDAEFVLHALWCRTLGFAFERIGLAARGRA
jgi:hypothetical protein